VYSLHSAGDLNCDGLISFGDINPFVLALTNGTAYAAAFPNCDRALADCNGDGYVDFGDINPFVAIVVGHAGGREPADDGAGIADGPVIRGRAQAGQ
jgi:hypothetical protein